MTPDPVSTSLPSRRNRTCYLEQTILPSRIESTVNEPPGLKLPRPFELALLRGNVERLFPRFKLKT